MLSLGMTEGGSLKLHRTQVNIRAKDRKESERVRVRGPAALTTRVP